MTQVTLVLGQDALSREKAIGSAIAKAHKRDAIAVILEGASPESAAMLDSLAQVSRIAMGCPCCTGKLSMQVTLNRALQRFPTHIYIGLASDPVHIEQFRDFLLQPPYTERLDLTSDIRLPDIP